MIKKTSAVSLTAALLYTSMAPAVPAFAADIQAVKPLALSAARVAPQSEALPGMLPVSSISGVPQADMAAMQTIEAQAAAQAAEVSVAPAAAKPNVFGSVAAPAAGETKDSPSVFARLAAALKSNLSGTRLFDAAGERAQLSPSAVGAMGLRPLPAPTLQGVTLDQPPVVPAAVQRFNFNKANGLSIPLNIAPASPATIERVLRSLVDNDRVIGVKSAELKTVHVKFVPGYQGQADTFFAYFQQQKDGLALDGSGLSFMVKVINGMAEVVDVDAHLYPGVSVDTHATLNDDQLKEKAEQKLPLPQSANPDYKLVARKILNVGGKWRAVNLYAIPNVKEARGIMVAVDVATGETFACDARHGVTAPQAAGSLAMVQGEARAMAENKDTRPNGMPELVEQALPYLNATVGRQSVQADTNGKFAVSTTGNFSATLDGKWASIIDSNNNPVKLVGTVAAGQPNVIVAQAKADDLLTLNQLNMFIWIHRIHDWWSVRLHGDNRIDQQIPVNVNIDQDCNAYYTPGTPSLNFFKESDRCSDTGRPGVGAHEYGHFVDDMIGGIVNGGMSEGWGDICSMFLLGTPIIGDGFLKGQNPSYIRHGENNYQYNKWDEVHAQGQAWMGFAWKLRKALIAKLGDAEGKAAVESLIIPTMFSKARDIPGQMAKVLLNATQKDGSILHEAEIRAAAKAHGITLPGDKSHLAPQAVTATPKAAVKLSRSTFNGSTAKVTIELSGDRTAVAELRLKALRAVGLAHIDYRNLRWHATGGPNGFEFTLEGSKDAVKYATQQIQRLAANS